ncbi:hypothetical protein IC621_06490 [Bacillus sp. IB182487]|uniref:Uncharacterized protein n=1 Tax=Metabacillus arenae TaxID=2771434 RepID=A0A926NKU6_9BACI|nr:hypothetical protein [Metabacillus arenae]MBD1379872.1 hypothetical protein [Metabacillus arenae]
MVSYRPYRQRQSPIKALEQIRKDEFGKYDLAVVETLTKLIGSLMSKSQLMLSDGRVADIVYFVENEPGRPIVKINDTEEVINLNENHQLYIKELM